MPITAKTMRKQLALMKPLVDASSLDMIRAGQNKVGALMKFTKRGKAVIEEHSFDNFNACWVLPKDETRQGVLLYLHGGGYTSGDMGYVKGNRILF